MQARETRLNAVGVVIEQRMHAMRTIAAASLYFLIVFGAGFLLGPVRVFWLEPRVGETTAVLCEAPLLFIVIVLSAWRVPLALGLKTTFGALAGMGLGALFLQQLADFAVGSLLRGLTPARQITRLGRPAGLVYIALLALFAAMPLLADPTRRRLTNVQRVHG
jgi:hypothetical protein